MFSIWLSASSSLSDPEPDKRACDIDNGFKVACELFKTSGNAPKVFEPGKEIFHKVAHFIQVRIKFGVWLFAVGFSWNDRIHVLSTSLIADGF